jgi:hypothetical protein
LRIWKGRLLMLVLSGVMYLQTPVYVSAAEEEQLYNEVGRLGGRVTIINHPELGRTPAAGHYFVLQREDCKKCLIGIRSDIEGNYEAFVAIGRYRILPIPSVSTGGGSDLIAPGQARTVDVKESPEWTRFDIELKLPKE